MDKLLYLLLYLVIMVVSYSCTFDSSKSQESNELPNIILIVTDDDDYSTLSSFGGEVRSPNIDELIQNGSTLTNFYNNSRCSPTRASILTGMYPHRVGVGDLCEKHTETQYECYKGYLDTSVQIIPQHLKTKGYQCYMSGKWHLGGLEEEKSNKIPTKRGFDKFFGIIKGASDYFGRKKNEYMNDEKLADLSEFDDFYSTDAFTTKGLEFIQTSVDQEKPFFLYLPYTAPHAPIGAKSELVEKYKQLYESKPFEQFAIDRYQNLIKKGLINSSWEYNSFPKYNSITPAVDFIDKLATHAAMMHTVDVNIGRIIKSLKSHQIFDNTIIIYFSDNGGTNSSLSGYFNVPFEGKKTELLEGGIKTSCVVSWPNKKLKHLTPDRLHVIDILPTIAEIINLPESDQYDGNSFYSNILSNSKNSSKTRDYLFWDLYDQQAVINKNWKWVNDKNGKDYLFNLNKDGFEQNNIAANHPDIIKKLKKKHKNNYSDLFDIPDFKTYKKEIKTKRRQLSNERH